MKRLQKVLCDVLAAHLAVGKPPRIPEAGVIFWQAFATLSETRAFGAHGPQPLALSEIEAWARLYRVPLRPVHVGVIRALDRVWMDYARAVAAGKPVGPLPELTGALFDVVV